MYTLMYNVQATAYIYMFQKKHTTTRGERLTCLLLVYKKIQSTTSVMLLRILLLCSYIFHPSFIQSCGSSLKMKHTHPDNYTFSTLPKPISKDFTELCVLQTAEPFREYFSLSTSTCDQPASFQAHLLPGTYHAACSFRLTHAPISGTYSLALATPTVFFKACECLRQWHTLFFSYVLLPS